MRSLPNAGEAINTVNRIDNLRSETLEVSPASAAFKLERESDLRFRMCATKIATVLDQCPKHQAALVPNSTLTRSRVLT